MSNSAPQKLFTEIISKRCSCMMLSSYASQVLFHADFQNKSKLARHRLQGKKMLLASHSATLLRRPLSPLSRYETSQRLRFVFSNHDCRDHGMRSTVLVPPFLDRARYYARIRLWLIPYTSLPSREKVPAKSQHTPYRSRSA